MTKSRRAMLKAAGGSLGIAGFASRAAATTGNEHDSPSGGCVRRVAETDEAVYYQSTCSTPNHVFKRDKRTGAVEYVEMEPQMTLAATPNDPNEVGVESVSGFNKGFARSNRFHKNIGNCSTRIYGDHEYKGVAVESNIPLNDYEGAVLGGMLCAAAPVPGGRIASIFFSGFCSALGVWVQKNVLDSTATWGMYDQDTGSFLDNKPILTAGASGKWMASPSELNGIAGAPYVHLGGD